MAQLKEAAQEVIRRCRVLAECTEEPGHITRTFLSPPMHDVHRHVRGWMEAAGLRVWVDTAGNIRGTAGSGPRLMIGSHLDTVPRAGAFDGILGVMMGIALAELRRGEVSVEIVGFSEEEGVRFGVPFIGSRALVGDPVMEDRVLDAIRSFGLDPALLSEAVIADDVRAYLEFHIEQGPVLEARNLAVGVVRAIAGQSRYEVTFRGKAGHAGTTPMNQRADALFAAAEWIRSVECIAARREGLVATVGKLAVEPGAANVIPGLVRASLDVRSERDADRVDAVREMLSAAQSLAVRGVSATFEPRLDESAVPMDPQMLGAIHAAAAGAGYQAPEMISGAGHDAMILARRVPVGMLFLRTPGGISHHPDESVLVEDVEAALSIGARFLEDWR